MLVRFSAPVEQASGAQGVSIVFYRWRGLNVVRDWAAPAQPRTANQLRARSVIMQLARDGWAALTDQQREAWEDWAKAHADFTRLDYRVNSPGLAAFVKCNFWRKVQGLSNLADAPASGPPPTITYIGGANVDGTNLTLYDLRHGIAGTTGYKAVIRIGLAPANGTSIARGVLRVATVDWTGAILTLPATGGEFQLTLGTLYREPQSGERWAVGVRVLDPNGVPSEEWAGAFRVTAI